MGIVVPFRNSVLADPAGPPHHHVRTPELEPLPVLFAELKVKCGHAEMAYEYDHEHDWIVVFKKDRFQGIWTWYLGQYCWTNAASSEPVLTCDDWHSAVLGTQLLYAFDSVI